MAAANTRMGLILALALAALSIACDWEDVLQSILLCGSGVAGLVTAIGMIRLEPEGSMQEWRAAPLLFGALAVLTLVVMAWASVDVAVEVVS